MAQSAKHANKLLAEKGVLMLMQDPPRLVAFRRTYHNPTTGIRVTLNPIPNVAQKSFFDEMLYGLNKRVDVDKILVEDGYLPLPVDHPRARATQLMQRFLPFFGTRPVEGDTNKYDGVIQRDPIESRMAFLSTARGLSPAVDPRARRAVEHITTLYPQHTSVVLPWSVYHMLYFYEKLPENGFELERNEEVVVVDRNHMMFFTVAPMLLFMWTGLLLVKLIFGF